MASSANLPQPTIEGKLFDDLTLRELADLLRPKLAAKEKKAESAAMRGQPVVVVPKGPTPSASLPLADLLRTKLAAIEKKEEYAAVLAKPVVVVPDEPTPSVSLLLTAPTVPMLRRKTKKKKKAAAAPLLPSTHRRPTACLLCCGVRRKCRVSRRPLWPISSCAYGVKKGAAPTPCRFPMKLITSSTSNNVKSCLPPPSNRVPSCPLVSHQCQEACTVQTHVVHMLDLSPWEPGGTAVLIVLLEFVVARRDTPWPPTQLEDELSRKEGRDVMGWPFGPCHCSSPSTVAAWIL